MDGEILAMAPQWISKTAHGRALQEGASKYEYPLNHPLRIILYYIVSYYVIYIISYLFYVLAKRLRRDGGESSPHLLWPCESTGDPSAEAFAHWQAARLHGEIMSIQIYLYMITFIYNNLIIL